MSRAAPQRAASRAVEDSRLGPARMTFYGTGDFTVNTVLASLNIVYVTYFLTQVAGLRPELAGMVQLIGRAVDAFTDPAMGRLSDHCHWRWGRRRPFFVLGALPFGISYALLWVDVSSGSQLQMFAYYTVMYVLLSLAMTVLSVPYLALLPEMALGYDSRTSLNTYRNVGSVLGIFAAVAFRPVALALGGGPGGFALTGSLYGVLIALPWLAVYASSWERPDFQQRETRVPLIEGIRVLARHRAFRLLTGAYLAGRVAMDLIGAMLILYFTHYLGRTEDFEITMVLFLGAVMIALPVWLRVAQHFDKATIFVIGSVWWLVGQLAFLLAEPDWPRWLLLAFPPLVGIGYAMVDLMPWSMIGEVVDADDLATGERREGLYNGVFMFVRKLAGTVAVWLALTLLGTLGFVKGLVQNEQALLAIRLLTSLGPALFLALSVWIIRGYPLTRVRHAEILAELEARNRSR